MLPTKNLFNIRCSETGNISSEFDKRKKKKQRGKPSSDRNQALTGKTQHKILSQKDTPFVYKTHSKYLTTYEHIIYEILYVRLYPLKLICELMTNMSDN